MCIFDKNGVCQAMVCYSNEDCNARDEKSNPKYADACNKCGKYHCECNK